MMRPADRTVRRRNWPFAALLFGALLFASPPNPAVADPVADSRAVIEQQLDAFATGDFDRAYAYAAPGIQRIFPTPEIFGDMVRRGYPMVIGPEVVDFLGAEPIPGGGVLQRLRLVDAQGQAFIARYTLALVEGAWRITGVVIERAPDIAV